MSEVQWEEEDGEDENKEMGFSKHATVTPMLLYNKIQWV